MGTNCAPVYATLVLAYLEETLYNKVGEIFDAEFQFYFEDNWKRFLDYYFLMFTQSQSDMKKLQELVNSLNPSIQFTFETNNYNLAF